MMLQRTCFSVIFSRHHRARTIASVLYQKLVGQKVLARPDFRYGAPLEIVPGI
jgi:hypothetical protein